MDFTCLNLTYVLCFVSLWRAHHIKTMCLVNICHVNLLGRELAESKLFLETLPLLCYLRLVAQLLEKLYCKVTNIKFGGT